MTRSPSRKAVTPAPRSATVPATSWPQIMGNVSVGQAPLR